MDYNSSKIICNAWKNLLLNTKEEEKKYNLLKEASMQLDEPVWECQTNSISVILLLKEKYFVRTKETTIN